MAQVSANSGTAKPTNNGNKSGSGNNVKTAAGVNAQPGQVATPVRAAPFKIETPSTRKRHLKLLVYGDYGSGKTTLAGSATMCSQMSDVLLIDAESGDLSLDEFPGLDTIRITDFKTMGQVHTFLKRHCKLRDEGDTEGLRELQAMLRGEVPEGEEPKRYNTIIIDSLTEVETFCMYQLLGINDQTKMDEEVATAEWSEYKRNHQMIQRMVRQFRDLPMNVIFTCARAYVQDESKKMIYNPALTGKLASQIQGFMDMVGYLVVAQPQDPEKPPPRRLYVQPSSAGRYSAKSRFASYKGTYFDDPTMESILSAVGLLQQ